MSFKDKNKLDSIDLSNICKFNFINSISECRNGKINFFWKLQTSGDTVLDMKDFENCEEGTILLLAVHNPYDSIIYTNSAHNWYLDTNSVPVGEDRYITTGETILATIKSGEIHVFRLWK